MSAASPPGLGDRVAEPFRSDPDFWRSVCASADALALLVVALAGAALLGLTDADAVLVWLPFVVPVLFLARAARSAVRFHRSQEPLPSVVGTATGELSWRDAERVAVAAVFGRALVRSRHATT